MKLWRQKQRYKTTFFSFFPRLKLLSSPDGRCRNIKGTFDFHDLTTLRLVFRCSVHRGAISKSIIQQKRSEYLMEAVSRYLPTNLVAGSEFAPPPFPLDITFPYLGGTSPPRGRPTHGRTGIQLYVCTYG